MCDYHTGNFYEPPSVDPCEAVCAKQDAIAAEIKAGTREPLKQHEIEELAAELVHPDERR